MYLIKLQVTVGHALVHHLDLNKLLLLQEQEPEQDSEIQSDNELQPEQPPQPPRHQDLQTDSDQGPRVIPGLPTIEIIFSPEIILVKDLAAQHQQETTCSPAAKL